MITIKYKSNSKAVKQAVKQAALDGIREGAQPVYEKSQAIVPLDETPLQQSGTIQQIGNNVYIGYGFGESAAYAVIQHENLQYAHAPGRQAKYLEQPFRENVDAIIRLVAQRVKGVL